MLTTISVYSSCSPDLSALDRIKFLRTRLRCVTLNGKDKGKYGPLTALQNTHTTQCNDKTLLNFRRNVCLFVCLFLLSLTTSTYSLHVLTVTVAPDPTHRQRNRQTDTHTHTHTHTHRPRARPVAETTHNIQKKQTAMPQAGLEPAIPASDRKQTCALDRAATGRERHFATSFQGQPLSPTRICTEYCVLRKHKLLQLYNVFSKIFGPRKKKIKLDCRIKRNDNCLIC